MGDAYIRLVPRAVEQLSERVGYMLVLFAAFETWILSPSGASSVSDRP